MFRYRQYGMKSANINTFNCNVNNIRNNTLNINNNNNNCTPFAKPLPLSKKNNLNTSTNDSSRSCKMRYAEQVRLYSGKVVIVTPHSS